MIQRNLRASHFKILSCIQRHPCGSPHQDTELNTFDFFNKNWSFGFGTMSRIVL